MPELPDVEISKEYFQATALHQEINGIEVKSSDVLEGVSKQRLIEKLSQRKFCGGITSQRMAASTVRVATFCLQK